MISTYSAAAPLDVPPPGGFIEAWLICGRRAGKSFILARIADLAEQRKATAFQALSGDAAARQRLDDCTRATVTAGLDLENIVSAIVEAETRVKQAEAAAGRALDHQRARETLTKVDDLAYLAADCDSALRNFLLAYDRLRKMHGPTRMPRSPR
jgi:hypothetical protein